MQSPLPHRPSPGGSLVWPGSLCCGGVEAHAGEKQYLLQQSYPHGPVGGGEHLHDDGNYLLLVLLRGEELAHLAEEESGTHKESQGKDIHPFVLISQSGNPLKKIQIKTHDLDILS